MLYIRADGNTDIGMGHVMRCLSVAEAAADQDSACRPVFVTADAGCRGMIADRGFETVVLDTDYRDMMAELPLLERMLDRERDVVLVDSYQVSGRYFAALGALAGTACLEDMGNAYPVGLLINYNLYAPELAQRYRMQGYAGRLLLGAQYTPLGRAFQAPSGYVVRERVSVVTITTGGSDPYLASAALADAFLADDVLSQQEIVFHIIIGPFNRFSEQLKERYGSCGKVVLHEAVRDMRSLLLASDVVVTASGSTVYEVSSLGIPMIVFYFAENQRQGAQALGSRTEIVNAGCIAEDQELVAQRAAAALRRCTEDVGYRQRLSAQEKGLIDGKGARRIAETLTDMMSHR